MAGEEFEVTTPLLENILNQAEALRAVSAHQFGEGHPALENAAAFLKSKKRVVLSGMGASYFGCIPFQYLLARRGIDVKCVETAELLYFLPRSFDENTALALVSRSGESIEVTKLLASIDTPTLGMVNVAESTLAKQANHFLCLNSPADQLVAIQTYTATLAVFALLDAEIGGELHQARVDLQETIKILDALIPKWVEAREGWKPFLDDAKPLYLLGRGASLGAVSEGVLLMHETAKAAAVGMSVPQFRHGPVEVVDADFRAIVIGTQPETAELDAALANDVMKMGGQVRWLGPEVKGRKAPALCEWPLELPARFQSIVETIPLQIAAYTKAELNGIRPGDFRWAPAITSSEAGF
jgi:glucosamine--fructose-6-phosphate aminotransferase (isomerizing)